MPERSIGLLLVLILLLKLSPGIEFKTPVPKRATLPTGVTPPIAPVKVMGVAAGRIGPADLSVRATAGGIGEPSIVEPKLNWMRPTVSISVAEVSVTGLGPPVTMKFVSLNPGVTVPIFPPKLILPVPEERVRPCMLSAATRIPALKEIGPLGVVVIVVGPTKLRVTCPLKATEEAKIFEQFAPRTMSAFTPKAVVVALKAPSGVPDVPIDPPKPICWLPARTDKPKPPPMVFVKVTIPLAVETTELAVRPTPPPFVVLKMMAAPAEVDVILPPSEIAFEAPPSAL